MTSSTPLAPLVPKTAGQDAPTSPRLIAGPDGCLIWPDGRRGASTKMLPTGYQICAARMTMESLVNHLGGFMDRPLIDNTGLKGNYDFKFEFTPERMLRNDDAAAPSIFTALPQQLGLKLEPATHLYSVLVVDGIDRVPVEN